MATGRSQPSIVMDVQVLMTQAASVATMEREMGNPPRLIRTPDVCYLFPARDAERLPGVVDRWASYGIAAQVVLIPLTGGQSTRSSHSTPSSRSRQAGHDTGTLATGLVRQTGPRMARPATGETRMRSTTDHVHEGRDQTAPPSPDAQVADGPLDAPRETEATFEEIER